MSRTSPRGLLFFVSLLGLGLVWAAPAQAQSVGPEQALLANGYAIPFTMTDDFPADEAGAVRPQLPDPERALLGRSGETAVGSSHEAARPAAGGPTRLDGRRALLGASPSAPREVTAL